MSKRSNSPSSPSPKKRKKTEPALGRPFAAKVLAEASKLAGAYQLVITSDDDVGYVGRTVEMPLVMADAETIDGCVAATLEATVAAIATLLELGEQPPSPAKLGKRDRQVNIRLTADEKSRLEEAARREGFRSLSDYLRSAGIQRAG